MNEYEAMKVELGRLPESYVIIAHILAYDSNIVVLKAEFGGLLERYVIISHIIAYDLI